MKRSFVVSIVFVLMFFSTGCTFQTVGEELSTQGNMEDKEIETIKVGIFQPLTGPASSGGRMTLEGIQLANELFPEVLGKE